MAKVIRINPNGGRVYFGVRVDSHKVGFYRASLIDANNKVVHRWEGQRTDDRIPDMFPIELPPSQLKGNILWVELNVGDPTSNGGTYKAEVGIFQDKNLIGGDDYDGNVPAGKHRLDISAIEMELNY